MHPGAYLLHTGRGQGWTPVVEAKAAPIHSPTVWLEGLQ